jgi:hypothetical protein
MSSNEVSYLIELRKRRQEALFKLGYLKYKGKGAIDAAYARFEADHYSLCEQVAKLEHTLSMKNVHMFMPSQKEIETINAKLAVIPPDEYYKAVEAKAGETYALLERRGLLYKRNHEKKQEIAELVAFCSFSLPGAMRDEVSSMVENGAVTRLDTSIIEPDKTKALWKRLNRCGIQCVLADRIIQGEGEGLKWDEVVVEIGGVNVWVEPARAAEAKKISSELTDVSTKLQIAGAERHVRKMEEAEEQAYRKMQEQYVAIMKKRESMMG